MGRRLVVLIVAVGLSSAALATAAAPEMPNRPTPPLAGSEVSQSSIILGVKKAESERALQWLETKFELELGVPLGVSLKEGLKPDGKARGVQLDSQGKWHESDKSPMGGCWVYIRAEHGHTTTRAKLRKYRGFLAHEITHCLQMRAIGVRPSYRMNIGEKWLSEGSADWVANEYIGTENGDYWWQYITLPEASLFTRTYDGHGFFAHIARRANAWKVIPAMWGEWKRFFNDPKPFLVAQKSLGESREAQDHFLQTWAMSYARRRDLGPDWVMVGTGIPGPEVTAIPTPVSIGQLGIFTDPINEASVKLLDLNVRKGLVIRVSATGYGAIRWLKPSRTEGRFANSARDYCIDCKCPTGETLDPVVQKVNATKAVVALTGGVEKGFVVIRSRPVKEVCVPGTASPTGRDPCIYSVGVATGLIAARVGGHHPVEDVDMQFFRKAPPIPKHLQPPRRAVTACIYLSSFGDAIWVDRLTDGSLWITYIGYPRDEVLNGTGCCWLAARRLGHWASAGRAARHTGAARLWRKTQLLPVNAGP